MLQILPLMMLAAMHAGSRHSGCSEMLLLRAVTDVERTFIRKGFGEWGSPRKDGVHKGVDILVRQSFSDKAYYAVTAPGNGVVAYAQPNPNIDSGYGNVVVIDLANDCYMLFAHLAHQPLSLPGNEVKLDVAVGRAVRAGDIVGYMVRPEGVSSTGNARSIDIANQHQVHVAFIDAPSGRKGKGMLAAVILQADGRYMDPTATLRTMGYKVEVSAGDPSGTERK